MSKKEDKSGYRTKISVSSFMGDLKGKSSLMIFDKHANLKYRFTGEPIKTSKK